MTIASEVSADLLWKHLEAICQWERYTGKPGEAQAVSYIERELMKVGISVTVHEVDAWISIPGNASLEILGEENVSLPVITAAFGATTGEGGILGDAIFVGDASEPTGPVAGRIVVGERMVMPGRFFAFERAGAIAQVYVNMGLTHEMTVSTIWGSPTPESVDRYPRTPVVSLTREQGQSLIDRLKAKEEVKLRVSAETDTGWRKTVMPVATIDPPGGAGEYVLLGGHIDSWHMGANDNAAGNTTLMELARLIQNHRGDLRRGLRVAWWNGHSHGRFSGSTWYADHMFEDLRAGCVAYLNIDQPGCRQCTLYRPFSTSEISRWVQDVVGRFGGQKVKPNPPQKMADQSFWGVGIPSFSFLPVLSPDSPELQKDYPASGFPEYWHNPADTLDKMDKELLAEHARLYASALLELCTAERVPLDPRTTALAVETELENLQKRTGGSFDLMRAISASSRFTAAAKNLMDGIDSLEPGKANRTLLRISHALNPVLYTQLGPFDQDPATVAMTLPGFQQLDEFLAAGPASHEGRLFYTRLVRERNRLCAALLSATEAASL